MKKLLLFLIFLSPMFLNAEEVKIDERINDIYFANGIMNTRTQAQDSSDLIYNATLQDIYNNNLSEMKLETNYKLLYNESHGMFEDLLEAFQQKRAEHKYYWLAADTVISMACGLFNPLAIAQSLGMSALDIWLDMKQEELDMPMLKNIVEAILSAVTLDICGTITSTLGAVGDNFRSEDIEAQYNNVTQSIKLGHNVIAIAHSQGNFFFNEIHSKILNEDSTYWMRQYIKGIAVSSPSNKIAFNTFALTYDNDPVTYMPDRIEDKIVNPLRYIFPRSINEDAMIPSICGAFLYLEDEVPTDECALYHSLTMQDVKAASFHGFEYYMQESLTSRLSGVSIPNPSRSMIMNALKETIEGNRKAPSQWKLKRANTCKADYYYFKKKPIAHKYDDALSSLYQYDEAFGFDDEGKLYSAVNEYGHDTYVKSKSIYGNHLIDTMSNLTLNECYLLKDENNITLGSICDGKDEIPEIIPQAVLWR
ncbi:MAG: hypothetical protein LBP40_05490 [Campylobacteraceae bacterium]|jgi:hypothetical protein|nr:hypothetical protein [Campylobacteraceae bacterium]